MPNVSVPVNRSRRLLGGSQHTSPEESTEKIRGKYYFSETWKLRRQTSWLCFIEVNFFLNSIVQKNRSLVNLLISSHCLEKELTYQLQFVLFIFYQLTKQNEDSLYEGEMLEE